jgi:tetratricopeptide (TPR) repeat protein
LYSYSIGDLNSSARSVESLIRIFETNEFLLKENQFKYVQSVYNYAVVKLALKKYADVEKAVEKFTAIDSKETRIHRSIFTMKFILLSAVYIARKEFDKVVAMEEDILKGLKLFRNKINTKDFQALHFNLASSYFSIENYGKCISHLNAFLNEQKENLNKDIFTISELLFVLAHYELGNLELIRSLIKQAKKNFEAYHADWEIEKLVFDFLLNTDYTNKKELHAKELNVLKHNVKKSLKTKAANYKDSNYNYILDWIDKKHPKNKLN